MPSRAALAAIPQVPVDPSAGANTFGNTGAPGSAGPPGLAAAPDPSAPPPPMEVTPTDDGGVDIQEITQTIESQPAEHSENLAETMGDDELSKLAEQVITWKENDESSRSEWYASLTEGMKLLGLKISDRSTPFAGATGVFDTLMLEAVLRNQAQTASELLPAGGPVKTQIMGIPTEETEQRATRVKDFMNWWFTDAAPEWVEAHEQMYLWRAIVGSVFTKTYQDPILKRPVSPWLGPEQLIISYHSDPEMESCARISEVMSLTFKEIRERQLSGFYRDISLLPPEKSGSPNAVRAEVDSITGVSPASMDSQYMFDKDFEVIEQHVDLDLDSLKDKSSASTDTTKNKRLPQPYIVSVETTTRKVLAVRRNWRENDETFQKQQYYTHHRLIPGLGFYGIGYAHILGNPAKAATSLQRQMIDAATLEMFPGGLRVKGMRMDTNNKMIGPCEFIEIDTGGLPIGNAVAPMPYKGPSDVSFNLWVKGRENAQSLGNMADISVGDGRQDAPVGTTLALLEAANRMMSATIKSGHRSLKREFKLFAALFGQYLPAKPYPFPVAGGMKAIMRQDFSDDIDVIPVSDPNITSYAQRVTRAEMMLRSAMQAPQIHDLRAAYKNMYVEAGVDERKIDAILPPPQAAVPMDPLSENQMALQQKPLAVAAYQDHQAHIQAHSVLLEQMPTIAAHISEHLAAAMRVNVEKLLGHPLPPMGTKLPPDVENKIAVMVAQALDKLKSPQGQEPTPGTIAMAEIQVEASKVQATLQQTEAQAAQTAYKEQMTNQREQEKLRQQTAIALVKEQAAAQREQVKADTARAVAARRGNGQGWPRLGVGRWRAGND